MARDPTGAADSVFVSAEELTRLQQELDRHLDAAPKEWLGWAARVWCRCLLADPAGAEADLH